MIRIAFDMNNYYFAIESILINVKKKIVCYGIKENYKSGNAIFPGHKIIPKPAYYS